MSRTDSYQYDWLISARLLFIVGAGQAGVNVLGHCKLPPGTSQGLLCCVSDATLRDTSSARHGTVPAVLDWPMLAGGVFSGGVVERGEPECGDNYAILHPRGSELFNLSYS